MNKNYVIPRIQNNVDASHCLQFAFMAAVEAATGRTMSTEEAEAATGFQAGGTWPYAMLNWFAENEFEVRHIELMDLELFALNPEAALEKQGLDPATIQLFGEITDLELERGRVQAVLREPRIEHEFRLPTAADIRGGLQESWLPLVSLDSSTLNGGSYGEFEGHMVLASDADEAGIVLQDPGPPPHWDWHVSDQTVQSAMRVPTEGSGSLTMVRPLKLAFGV